MFEAFAFVKKETSRFFVLSSFFLTIGTFFGLLLTLWTAVQQYQTYKTNQQILLNNSVHSVSLKISNLLSERIRILTAIAQDNRQILLQLHNNADNEALIAKFEYRLKAYFPDFIFFAIINEKGKHASNYSGEQICELCVRDVTAFLQGDKKVTELIDGVNFYLPILHHQLFSSHFDLMTQISANDDSKLILFMSFHYEVLLKLLREHHISGEQLFLVRSDGSDLIEVGENGSREQLQRSFNLNKIDKKDLFIQKEIPGSRWKIVAFPEKGLFFTQINALFFQYGFLFVMIIIFYLSVLFILYRLNKQRNHAFDQLHLLNNNLETLIVERTQELTKLSTAVIQSPVEVIITDMKGIIEYINPKFTEITGYSQKEAVGSNIMLFKSEEMDVDLIKTIWRTISEGQTWSGEFLNCHKNGTKYWLRFSVSPVRNDVDQITHYLGIGEEITEKKEQEKRILYQAHYDELTGIPNRLLAIDRLKQAIQLCSRTEYMVVLIFIDLDNFKKINDTLGHDCGDILLIETAQRLKSVLREADTIARLGGDEFLIILSQVKDKKYIDTIANKLLKQFQEPICTKCSECMITASLGISVFPDDGMDALNLMRSADLAMYQSKDSGRNQYHFFTSSFEEKAQKHFQIEKHLHHALERNELSVVYQPIIKMESDQLAGCEALVRWNNPTLGVIGPDIFIPVAEQSGLITSIGEFVLQTACSQLAYWNATYQQTLFIAVNLSPRQFREKDFISKINSVINKTGLSPSCLELEVTEGMIIKNHKETQIIMNTLIKMGIKLSMDDFGTGYSSLYHLKKFHFDKLKIDRSFIQELDINSDDFTLVQTTIALAHGLGLKVVAEGIEEMHQLQILKDEQCDFGQGYFYSRPIPAEEFELAFVKKTLASKKTLILQDEINSDI